METFPPPVYYPAATYAPLAWQKYRPQALAQPLPDLQAHATCLGDRRRVATGSSQLHHFLPLAVAALPSARFNSGRR